MSSMLTALAERWRDALELFEEMIEERVIIYIYLLQKHIIFFWHLKKPLLSLAASGGGKYRKEFSKGN